MGFDGSQAATVKMAQRQWNALGAQRAAFCPICRTRGCAHLEKLETEIKLQQKHVLKRDVLAHPAPNIFVGYSGYPSVNLGPLALNPTWTRRGLTTPSAGTATPCKTSCIFAACSPGEKKGIG